jgi:inner membrane protein
VHFKLYPGRPGFYFSRMVDCGMDNLSHSLTGLAVGELVHRSVAPEPEAASQQVRRRMLLVSCWAASNFPDLDLVFTSLLPRPLGYLLHHRGHTHTLLFALPQALLLAALIWLLWPAARRLLATSGNARRALLYAITLGFLLHLSMDFLNSYGIHPIYPVDQRWLYGDMVFILEPVFWIATGVPLALMVKRKFIGVPLLLLLTGVPLFAFQAGFLHWGSLILLALVGLVAGAAQAHAGTHGRSGLLTGLAACLLFVAVQGVGSARCRRIPPIRCASISSRSNATKLAALTGCAAACWAWRRRCWRQASVPPVCRAVRPGVSLRPGSRSCSIMTAAWRRCAGSRGTTAISAPGCALRGRRN